MAPRPHGRRGLRRTAAVTAAVAAAVAAGGAPPPVAARLNSCNLRFGRELNAYLYCQDLPGDVSASLYWSPSPDGSSLLMALRADTPGWVGFAFSDDEQMVGNVAMVGTTTKAGDTTASAYRLSGKRSTAVTVLLEASAASAGFTNMAAERPSPTELKMYWTVAVPDGESATGVRGAIWSVGGPLDVNGVLEKHTARSSAQIDFSKSDVETGARGGVQEEADDTDANAISNDDDDDDDTFAADDTAADDPLFGDVSDSDDDDDEGSAPDDSDSDGENESACFPSDATVTLASGATVRMDALAVGDEVAVGGGRTSPVFVFSHADAAARTPFVRVTGVAAAAAAAAAPPTLLTASPGHYVYVNGRLAAAGTIVAGDRLRGADGADTVIVGAVDRVVRAGLWNPHTLSGELLVGGGVVASTYTTAVAPAVARAALAPLAAAWSATGGWRVGGGGGGWAPAATAAAEACRRQVARWLPRGAAVVGGSA